MSDNGTPDRLYIPDRDPYEKISNSDYLKDKKNRVYYMMALTLGWVNGERIKLDSREGYVRTSYLKDTDKALIKAIAVAEEEDLNILTEKEKVYSIADEYAASGVILLKDEVFGKSGSLPKKLEKRLKRKNDEIQDELG